MGASKRRRAKEFWKRQKFIGEIDTPPARDSKPEPMAPLPAATPKPQVEGRK